MKQHLTQTSWAIALLGFLVSPTSFAESTSASTASSDKEQKMVQALANKTAELEKELVALRQQIAELKKAKTPVVSQKNVAKATQASSAPAASSATAATSSVAAASSTTESNSQQYTASSPEAFPTHLESTLTVHTVPENNTDGNRYYPTALTADGKVLTYIAGVPVVTSPYLGGQPAFDGSDLIINISKINQDIRLMEQRDLIEQQFVSQGYSKPDTPIVMLSGTLQPMATYSKPYSGSASGNMTLDAAELDVTAIVNPWVEGLISFVYSSAPPAQGGDVTANSSVSVDKAFVNIGNLDKTPLYMTAGQVYVPFGQYSSNMISAPLTMIVGRTQVRAAMFGYAPTEDNGFFGTVFTYNSNTTEGNSGSGGANLVYQFGNDDINGNFGGSWISNIADSGGMQDTGAGGGQFGGFGTDSSTEAVYQVPGYDFHGVFNAGPYSFLGEFVSSAKDFGASALSYNGSGAMPMAVNAEAARTFKFLHKPATVALGYGWSGQSLALQIPQQRLVAAFNVSWWRDTIESLEYRHDMDYSSASYAGGIGSSVNTTGTGGSSDTISALLSVYF